jgi:hypothetical protein
MGPPSSDPQELVATVLAELGARAAGLWKVEGDRLAQVVFVAGPELSDEVAAGFADATRSVDLTQTGLGIVSAARTGEAAVSLATARPEHSGSGGWLRRFGASRSVAVPLHGLGGAVVGVLSVALAADQPDSETVAARLRVAGRRWAFAQDWTSGHAGTTME